MLSLGGTFVVHVANIFHDFMSFKTFLSANQFKKKIGFVYYFLTASLYFAATVECILLLRFIIGNVMNYYNQDKLQDKYKGFRVYFPYSVLLSAIGTVFVILGCVFSVVVYHKSRDEDLQKKISTVDHDISLSVVEQELSTRNENDNPKSEHRL